VRPEILSEIEPEPSTGVPLELEEICHVPLAVAVPTSPVYPVMSMVSPLFVMFVHDPCAFEKFTPAVPPVRVISIQNREPELAKFGDSQLLVLTPFKVALPSPLSFSGVVPLQFGDCTFEPFSVIVPDASWFAPAESLEMMYVPETLNSEDPDPLIPMVSPPLVMLVYEPVAALKV